MGKNTDLKKAYYTLSPYKQKEYAEYIATAKQEKTKLSRLEKSIPLTLEGKGLNDKYR
ncbi:YdeI/OmpD-associated family protein [Winogradskyella maritima]|nr:YdeI/OmpD-associated family protein [Winogradskyella maritima]